MNQDYHHDHAEQSLTFDGVESALSVVDRRLGDFQLSDLPTDDFAEAICRQTFWEYDDSEAAMLVAPKRTDVALLPLSILIQGVKIELLTS